MQIYAKNTHDRYFYETFANNLHSIHEYKFQFSFKIITFVHPLSIDHNSKIKIFDIFIIKNIKSDSDKTILINYFKLQITK